MLGALFPDSFYVQGQLAVIGLFFCCILQAYTQPFTSKEMNTLEAVSLWTSLFTYFVGQFTFTPYINADDYYFSIGGQTAHALAFVANIGFVIYALVLFAKMKRASSRGKTFIDRRTSTVDGKINAIDSDAVDMKNFTVSSGAFEGMDFVDFINEFPPGPRVNAFKAFLKSEFSDENIDFYVECYEFRIRAGHDPNAPPLALWEKAGKPPPLSDELKPVLKAICDQHVRDGSPRQVNLPARLQKAVLTAVDSDVITTVVLDDAFHEIIKLMGRDSFPRFMETEHWRNLLTHTEV